MYVPTVCLIGKPNVGKSTVFNRLVGKKISIIEDTPGVTRDRIYGYVNYKSYSFHLIDTGGIEISKEDFTSDIKVQAEIAIKEADVVVFIVDGKEGLTASDYLIRDMLKKTKKKVIVAINKIDNKKSQENIYDFYELGFNSFIQVSGEHNIGIGKLLDEIVNDFDKKEEIIYAKDIIKFSIVGRPNVGKSSLVNSLLNEDRIIVSDIAGTTRDAIDTEFTYDKNKYVAIDTAGMRKKGKVYENIEKYSMIRSLKAIERSDVCILVINAEEGIIEHDKHIAGYCIEAGKPMVLVVNKWDLVKDPNITKWINKMRVEFQFLSYIPIVFLSAKTKKRIHTLMPEVLRVYENSKREIKTSILNNIIMDAVSLNSPPSYKGKRLKIYFCAQTGVCPPKYTLNVNDKKLVHFSYYRYLENKIRESIDLVGTPIILQFKNKNE